MPYHDPYNLEYYLLNSIPLKEIQVIKEYSEETAFGDVQLAIVGSSHYFYLYKEFCELLTCRSIRNSDQCFCMNEIKENSMKYHQIFTNFSYDFSLEVNVLSAKEFNKLEKDLNGSQHTLFHAFHAQSALTVLDFRNLSDSSIKLETWHTYPENFISVRSNTVLTRI